MDRTSGSQYLHEVQGLRTVAALLVAVYHIWFHRVSGGVDVFFVVAAFFMGASFLRKTPIGLKHVVEYHLATLRRVMPGAALVIVATILLCLLLLPKSSWDMEIRRAGASLLFLTNIQLARSGVDYLSADAAPSPFQQLWALSLQMQFYFVFPVILLACQATADKMRLQFRQVAGPAFALIFLLSLGWSIYETAEIQPRAYFNPAARAWEFAAGVLLALAIHRINIAAYVARLIGIGSVIVLASFAAVLDVSRLFPGFVALIPVLAAAGVIVASRNGGDVPILNSKLAVALADYSFAFYLWHWPLLIFTRLWIGSEDVGLLPGLLIIFASGIFAVASTRYLEAPFRRSSYISQRPILSLCLTICILLPGFAAASVWHFQKQAMERQAWADVKRYLSSGRNDVLRAGSVIPAAIIARDDLPPSYRDGCHQDDRAPELIECVYGVKDAARSVVIVGGSHSLQWLPVIQRLAKIKKFKIINMTKSGCFFGQGEERRERLHPSCATWNAQAMRRILALKPDLVFTIATRSVGRREGMPASYVAAWKRLSEADIPVLALRDNPWLDRDPVECAEQHGYAENECGIERNAFYPIEDPTKSVSLPNLKFADLTGDYCPTAGYCPVVMDGILRYRDKHHLSQTYILTLEPRVAEMFDEVQRARS